MPQQKRKKLPPFPWAKGNGTLSTWAQGFLYGMKQCNTPLADIADRLDVDVSTVRRCIAAVEKQLAEQCGSMEIPTLRGAHPSTDERQKLVDDAGLAVGVRTVRRDMKRAGLVSVVRPLVPALSNVQKMKRLALSETLLMTDEKTILFSDESLFLCRDMSKRQWVIAGEDPKPIEMMRWTSALHVWGFIGFNYRHLVVLKHDRVDAEKYVQTCETHLLPLMDVSNHVFMQDNARPHVAKKTLEFFEEKKVKLLPWPANSPDLNPIEEMWGLLKRKMQISVRAKKSELETEIFRVWNELPIETTNNLVLSFHKRVRLMVAAEGGQVTHKRRRESEPPNFSLE